jgi:hypothetical protein
VVLTLGAGDVTVLSHRIVEELEFLAPPTLEFDG